MAATPTDSRRHESTGQQGLSRRSRAEGRDSSLKAQPAASSLSRRETICRADPFGHLGSSQQACEWGRRGSADHVVSPSMPTHRGSTTDQSRSSSSGELRIVHVSEKPTESVPLADVTSRVDGPAQLADPADAAGQPETADPARTADLAGEPESTRGEQPYRPSTAESAGPSRMDGPSRLQPAARADPAGVTVADPSQDQSAVGPHTVSMPRLMSENDHTPLDQRPVTHQHPASNQDVSVDSEATIFPSIPKYSDSAKFL